MIDYFKQKIPDLIKIGSTKLPHVKLVLYQTNIYYNLKYNNLYQITKAELDCYEIDNLIQKTFLNSNINNYRT